MSLGPEMLQTLYKNAPIGGGSLAEVHCHSIADLRYLLALGEAPDSPTTPSRVFDVPVFADPVRFRPGEVVGFDRDGNEVIRWPKATLTDTETP
jgi:hypothetical protein